MGDAQQSIYRFRGAEVEVFRRAQRRIEQGAAAGSEGSVVKLVKNFRSHAEAVSYTHLLTGAEISLLEDAARACGRATLLVPSFAERDVCRRALADARVGTGVDVTTPETWICLLYTSRGGRWAT